MNRGPLTPPGAPPPSQKCQSLYLLCDFDVGGRRGRLPQNDLDNFRGHLLIGFPGPVLDNDLQTPPLPLHQKKPTIRFFNIRFRGF